MKWREVRAVVTGKLGGEIEAAKKHDYGHVKCGDEYVGAVKIGHHTEMKPHEIGGCARMLGINEFQFKALVGCTLDQSTFCAIVSGTTEPRRAVPMARNSGPKDD